MGASNFLFLRTNKEQPYILRQPMNLLSSISQHLVVTSDLQNIETRLERCPNGPDVKDAELEYHPVITGLPSFSNSVWMVLQLSACRPWKKISEPNQMTFKNLDFLRLHKLTRILSKRDILKIWKIAKPARMVLV